MAEHSGIQHHDSPIDSETDDIEFQILDVESEILAVASTLAGILHFTSIDRYIVSLSLIHI